MRPFGHPDHKCVLPSTISSGLSSRVLVSRRQPRPSCGALQPAMAAAVGPSTTAASKSFKVCPMADRERQTDDGGPTPARPRNIVSTLCRPPWGRPCMNYQDASHLSLDLDASSLLAASQCHTSIKLDGESYTLAPVTVDASLTLRLAAPTCPACSSGQGEGGDGGPPGGVTTTNQHSVVVVQDGWLGAVTDRMFTLLRVAHSSLAFHLFFFSFGRLVLSVCSDHHSRADTEREEQRSHQIRAPGLFLLRRCSFAFLPPPPSLVSPRSAASSDSIPIGTRQESRVST